MSDRSLENRGYNQSELLAETLSGVLDIPVNNVLAKNRETFTQHELGADDRAKNLISAFSIYNGAEVKDKNFILCDDIITTGNTLKECSKVLKYNGARKIICCTIASAN